MSTPIAQLGIGQEQHDSFGASDQGMMPGGGMGNVNPPSDDALMNQVMDGVQHEVDPHASNINGEMMNHTMDPSQIPPEQQQQLPPEPDYPMDMSTSYHDVPEEQPMTQKIMDGVKGPFFVFILAFIINLPMVTRILTHFVPKLLQESGQLNWMGVLVKAFMIAVCYAIINAALL